MKRKSLIVFITQILAFLSVCTVLGCSVESSSGEEKPVVATYTVAYLTDKGISFGAASLLSPITVAEGTVISDTQLPKLSETGWNFIGWYDGETKVVAGTYEVTKNVTLVAKWNKSGQTEEPSNPSEDEPDKPAVTYTVSYSSDKGVSDAELLNPITVSEGTAITAEQLPELSAAGWSFEGWYDGEIKVVADYTVTKNITLVAKWTLNPKYTVEHWLQNLDDDEYVRKEVDSQQLYGKAGTMTTATAKNYPGFTAQQIEQRVIQPDGTTVVNIKYDRKIINLTFKLDGGNINGKTEDVVVSGRYEAKVPVSTVKEPLKENFKFKKWNKDIPQTFPVDDEEILAQYIGSFSITVNLVSWDDSDLKILKSETDDFVYNITVPEAYKNVSYYINGEKQEETSKDFKFEIPKRNGCFNLVVVAEKNGIKYSYSMNVVVDGLN